MYVMEILNKNSKKYPNVFACYCKFMPMEIKIEIIHVGELKIYKKYKLFNIKKPLLNKAILKKMSHSCLTTKYKV